MSPQRVRMIDVARAAGVSRATVSFVLNETPGQKIRADTAERVRGAAAELGYVPSRLALALREGTSRTVILSLGRRLSGHSMESFIAGLHAELAAHGHTLLVVHGGDGGGVVPDDVLELVRPHAVLDVADTYSSELEPAWEGGDIDGMAAHARTQLGHLVDRGHTRVAVVVPDDGGAFADARARHLRVAAELRGVQTVTWRLSEAPAALRTGDITGVAAYDDDTALAVLAIADELGLRIPDELAVIGFDDARHGALWRPALTTVSIDAAAYGKRAARRALGLPVVEDTDTGPRSRVIVRATT